MNTINHFPEMEKTLENSDVLNILEKFQEIQKLPAASDIIETTYTYSIFKDENGQPRRGEDGHVLVYNDFFEKFSGVSLQEIEQNPEKLGEVLKISEQKIDDYIALVNDLEKEIDARKIDENQKKLLLNLAKSFKNLFQIARLGLVFEVGKAGFLSSLTDAEENERIAQINAIQDAEFGVAVSEDSQSCLAAFKHARLDFQKEKNSLSDEEKSEKTRVYNLCREKILQKFPNLQIPDLDAEQKNLSRDDLKDFSNIIIPRDVYVKIFQLAIDMIGTRQKVEVSEKYSSIFDDSEVLGIPASKVYETKNLGDVLRLLMHEIMVHYVNQENSEKQFFGIRSAWNVEKEEWLAKLMELLIRGKTLDEALVEANALAEHRTLGMELFANGNISKEDLKIWKNLDANNEALLRRVCRNFPLEKGTQRKDLQYGKGMLKVAEYLKNGGDIKKLFIGKFGVDDIAAGEFDFIDAKTILYPIFVSDIVVFYLQEKQQRWEEINHENFVHFLHEKYGKLLSQEDYDNISKITYVNKKRIMKILHLIQQKEW